MTTACRMSHQCAAAHMQAKKSLKIIAQQSKMDEDAIEFLHKDASPDVTTCTSEAFLLPGFPQSQARQMLTT